MFSVRIRNTVTTPAKPWRNSADTVWKCCRLVLCKLSCCLPSQNGMICLEFMFIMSHFGKADAAAQPLNLELSYDWHPPVWITDTALRRSPFVPQMGDEVGTWIKNLPVLVIIVIAKYRKAFTVWTCWGVF